MPSVGALDIHRKEITFDYLETVTGRCGVHQGRWHGRAAARRWHGLGECGWGRGGAGEQRGSNPVVPTQVRSLTRTSGSAFDRL
jgi:hypothetical protein